MSKANESKHTNGRVLSHAACEFCSALRQGFTYAPRKNHEFIFGFLWGLPVPFFALLIHAYAARMPLTPATFAQVALENPIYIVFLLHPILFAVIFGALRTMRAHREE